MSFPARWPGTCTSCGDRFDEGDEIAYEDGEIVCERCADRPAPPRRGRPAPVTVAVRPKAQARTRVCARCNEEIPVALGRCENCS